MTATVRAALADVRRAVEDVADPEVPVLTLGDLGIVRDVREGPAGEVEVDLTPTYSGCPATEVIAADVVRAAGRLGRRARVHTVLSPAWTTDWMSAEGRRKLERYGIAPPSGRAAVSGPVDVTIGRAAPSPACPRCGSSSVEELSRFGTTACQSLWRCTACAEPFSHFKAI
ncbi:MAG TPA: 1,2-phenylacetyl-CoA epoxidase subunit PaaD [Actinomycetales bacterium]|nr:1,2-phenylacetyl-CoA epoxidase subunit PaaD [Actinomycetales bacterium]